MKNLNIKIILVAIGLLAITNLKVGSQRTTQDTTKDVQNVSSDTQQIELGVGQTAPEFSFETIDGKAVTLSELRGQPVLFAFALTEGCAACIIEARAVREAQQQIPFKVVQLAISPYETIESLQYFQKIYGASDWLVGFDKDNKISNSYKVKAADTTYIVDANGKIIYRDDGYPADVETMVTALKKL